MTHATSRRGLTNVLGPKTTDAKSPAKPENKSGGMASLRISKRPLQTCAGDPALIGT